jgi:hypothetical protein
MEWFGFGFVAALGFWWKVFSWVFSTPSSSVWISESWSRPTFLRLLLFLGYFFFLSRDEDVCLYISVGVFRLYFLFLPQTRVSSGLLQSTDSIPSTESISPVLLSFGILKVCSNY